MPDFDAAIRKLARLPVGTPYERVFVARQILDKVWQEGREAGYREAMRDQSTADLIADQEARDAAKGEIDG